VEAIGAGGNSLWSPAKPLLATDGLADGGRAFLNVVILPTGALLALGGQYQEGYGAQRQFYSPQLFENGDWHELDPNPMASQRTYHSTAVLLPDGRVFLGGGDSRDYDYEIFSPPYLKDPANRPVNPVWQAPAPFLDPDYDARVLDRDSGYTIGFDPLPFGQTITKAVLMAPCSTTHHSDMSQRYVELETSVTGGNQVQFKTNQLETVVPRGIYMLFIVTNTSVSHAIWVMFQ
jgi:hypothetical protein